MSEPERVRIADLPTLDSRPRPNLQKGATRLETKQAEAKDDRKAEARFVGIVRTRDGMKCRYCGRKVVVTMALVPERAEVHHIAKRSKAKALQLDPRNGILLCAEHHQDVERYKLQIIGTAAQMFTFEGKPFLDATHKLQFVESK